MLSAHPLSPLQKNFSRLVTRQACQKGKSVGRSSGGKTPTTDTLLEAKWISVVVNGGETLHVIIVTKTRELVLTFESG